MWWYSIKLQEPSDVSAVWFGGVTHSHTHFLSSSHYEPRNFTANMSKNTQDTQNLHHLMVFIKVEHDFLSFSFKFSWIFLHFLVRLHHSLRIFVWIFIHFSFDDDGGRFSPKTSCMLQNGEDPWPKPKSKPWKCTFLHVLVENHHMHPKFSFKNDFWTFQTHEWSSNKDACDDLQA